MKIALVILHADPARGGAERYTVDLAEALAQRGHDVQLLAQTFAPALPPGVTPVKMPAAMTRTLSYRRFLKGVDERVDREKYDIVHAMLPVRRCDVYHPHAGMASAALRKMNRFFNPRRLAMARVERQLLAQAKAPVVICLSEYVKKSVLQQRLPPVKLETLFNAVDLKKFDPAARPEARSAVRERFGMGDDKVVALIIAQDFERKGLREAIAATGKVADSRLVLLVVGKEKTEAFQEWAIYSGAGDRVIFAGPTADPYGFYQASDFFVLPTRHDPCSLVVLESLAMGKPVISTVFNGACEVMTEGVHGHVLQDPADISSLAAAMRQMLQSDTRNEMSHACLKLRPSLAYEIHLERLMRIYDVAKEQT